MSVVFIRAETAFSHANCYWNYQPTQKRRSWSIHVEQGGTKKETHTHTHTYTHILTHTLTHTHSHTYSHTHTHTHTHTYSHTHTHTRTHTDKRLKMQAMIETPTPALLLLITILLRKQTCLYYTTNSIIHTHTHTHTCVHTHTNMQACTDTHTDCMTEKTMMCAATRCTVWEIACSGDNWTSCANYCCTNHCYLCVCVFTLMCMCVCMCMCLWERERVNIHNDLWTERIFFSKLLIAYRNNYVILYVGYMISVRLHGGCRLTCPTFYMAGPVLLVGLWDPVPMGQ